MLTEEKQERITSILRHLQCDKIVLNHAVHLILDEMEAEDVGDIVSMVPASVYDAFKDLADDMPHTEEGWAKWIDVSIRCGVIYDRNLTAEQLEEGFLQSERHTRCAVEALRRYFAANQRS